MSLDSIIGSGSRSYSALNGLLSCCDDLLIDFSKMSLPEFGIVWADKNLQFAMFSIMFNPIYWNVVARLNYHTKFLEKIFNSRKLACAVFAVTIVFLGIYRDWLFTLAMKSQPVNPIFDRRDVYYGAWSMIIIGSLLVFSSFYALGFFGCFLGDYFGILLPYKISTFPFNIFDSPMYLGSTLNFLGTSLLYQSEAGVFLTILVALVYSGVVIFEDSFTQKIYSEAKKTSKSS